MLLKFMKEELSLDRSNLSDSYYEAKKIIKDLGLSCEIIDSCLNDCILCWKEDGKLDTYKVCVFCI